MNARPSLHQCIVRGGLLKLAFRIQIDCIRTDILFMGPHDRAAFGTVVPKVSFISHFFENAEVLIGDGSHIPHFVVCEGNFKLVINKWLYRFYSRIHDSPQWFNFIWMFTADGQSLIRHQIILMNLYPCCN